MATSDSGMGLLLAGASVDIFAPQIGAAERPLPIATIPEAVRFAANAAGRCSDWRRHGGPTGPVVTLTSVP